MKKLLLLLFLLPVLSVAQAPINLRTDSVAAYKKLQAGDSSRNGNLYIYNATTHKYTLFQSYADVNQRIDWVHENNRDTAATRDYVRKHGGESIHDTVTINNTIIHNSLSSNGWGKTYEPTYGFKYTDSILFLKVVSLMDNL